MIARRALLKTAALALPALPLGFGLSLGLGGCRRGGLPPLSPEAMAAVADGDPGVPRESLARAIDTLFTAGGIGETRAVAVFHDGRLVADRYAQGYGASTRFLGWSMTKTVTATLIGLLIADGRLRLDQPAPIPAWQRPGDPRGEVTLRQLLQMRSGLRSTETADPVEDADTVRMLFLDGRDNMAAWAEAQPLEAEPGTRFNYATTTGVILADIATRALTGLGGGGAMTTDTVDPSLRQRLMADYLHTRLAAPVGMASLVAEYDAAGTLEGGSMMHATAQDWGRFGEFLRNQGSVRGTQVVPREWVGFMTSPSPANPAYGAQLWLNRASRLGTELFPERGPADLFALVGHLGQYVLVTPSRRLTVVRLGHTVEAERAALRARLADLVALYPAA